MHNIWMGAHIETDELLKGHVERLITVLQVLLGTERVKGALLQHHLNACMPRGGAALPCIYGPAICALQQQSHDRLQLGICLQVATHA